MEERGFTIVAVALVLGLVVGSAFGYFFYRAMNDEPAPEPQPQVRDHNHLGLWLVLIATIALGVVTARSVFIHVSQ